MKKWSEVPANTKLWGGIILAAIVLVMLFALQRDQEPLSLNNLLGGRLINPPAAGGGAQPSQEQASQAAGGDAQASPSPTQASPAAPSQVTQVVTEGRRGCEITTTVRADAGQSVHMGHVTCGPQVQQQQRQASAQSRASARPATGAQQSPNAGAEAVAAARARAQAEARASASASASASAGSTSVDIPAVSGRGTVRYVNPVSGETLVGTVSSRQEAQDWLQKQEAECTRQLRAQPGANADASCNSLHRVSR